MRLLICGSRKWQDYVAVLEAIKAVTAVLGRPEVIIHGAARGADSYADCAAAYLRIPVEAYPVGQAMYDEHGKSAPAVRNRIMFLRGRPTHAIGFQDNFTQWSGTVDMLSICDAQDVPVACLSSRDQVMYWGSHGCPFGSLSDWISAATGGPVGTA